MKTAVQPANVITVVADRPYKSGDLTKIGAFTGVVAYDVEVGEELELSIVGAYEVKADTALAATVTTAVDIDIANMQVVDAGTGDSQAGAIIWKDKENGSTTAYLRLDGIAVA